jgi:hypothetical protein
MRISFGAPARPSSGSGSDGAPVRVKGTVTSVGGNSTDISIDAGATGIAAVSIIPDPDGRCPYVVRVDFEDDTFTDTNYVLFVTSYNEVSPYATYWGNPTTAGRQVGYCIVRLSGSGDGNPFADPMHVMIEAL